MADIGRIFPIDRGVPHFNAPANVRIIFTSSETKGIVLPDAENRTIVSSFVWTYRNVTDGRTDGQNPSSYSTALCIASNADAM